MTISYGAYYTAPASTDVDFLFDVYDESLGGNILVLPVPQISALGTVPDWAMGDAVLKMPYITGGIDGAREANGIPVLPAITVAVTGAINNPIPLPMLQVVGQAGAIGEMVFPLPSVGLTATFTYKLGDVDIPDFSVEAVATTPWVLRGGIDLSHLVCSGFTGARVSQIIPDLTVSGNAISVAPGTGRFFVPALALSGVADTEYLGVGSYSLPRVAISGSLDVGAVGVGAITLPHVTFTGPSAFSPIGDRAGDYLLPLARFAGVGDTPKAETIIRYEATVCSA